MPRDLCPKCYKPQRACLCDLASPVQTSVEVVIWQHPSETNHPKNSVSLLQLSLADVRTLVAEQCSESEFHAWCDKNRGDNSNRTNVILSPLFNSPEYPIKSELELDHLRLIVIDGTWRKARKICHLNPWLQSLPALALERNHQPLYQMRKPEKPGQYSTLEAVCLALAQLEHNPHKYHPLLQSFVEFNRRWDSFRN